MSNPFVRRGVARAVIILCIAGVIYIPGVSLAAASSATNAAAVTWGDCPFEAGPRTKCGRITVAENRADTSKGRQISLSFVVVSASAPDTAREPVAFLTGGPGVSAYFALGNVESLPLGRKYDLIVMEPRGYGYSEPWLSCNSVEELAQCHEEATASGVDVEQYTTAASVEDYEALRQALGYPRWNLLGVSYGTYWASLYSRMHPQSLRAIIMDSPYPLNAGYDWNRVAALNGFERMFNACKADAGCNQSYPDLRNRFIDTLRRLKSKPAMVPSNGGSKPLDHIAAFQPLFSSLYLSNTLAHTPKIINALAREDYALFQQLAAIPFATPAKGFDYQRIRSLGLNASVMCKEDIFFPAAVETRVAFIAPWPQDIVELITPEGWDYDRRCRDWPVTRLDPSINEAVANDIPTLVAVGAFDPVTPPEFAEAMLLHLSNATLAVDPSTSHGLFLHDNACFHAIMEKFLDTPGTAPDVSCLLKTPPVAWELPD